MSSHPTITDEMLRAALGGVIDPEIRKPITELGMVETADVDADGHASATIENVQTRALYAAKRAHAKSVRAARAPSYRRLRRSARATRAFCVVGR